MIESYTILEVTDDEGEIHLLINIKYTLIVADTRSPILTTPHSTSIVLYENKVPIKYKGDHRHNKTMQLHVSQFILYISFGGFNPIPKCV